MMEWLIQLEIGIATETAQAIQNPASSVGGNDLLFTKRCKGACVLIKTMKWQVGSIFISLLCPNRYNKAGRVEHWILVSFLWFVSLDTQRNEEGVRNNQSGFQERSCHFEGGTTEKSPKHQPAVWETSHTNTKAFPKVRKDSCDIEFRAFA